MCKEDGFTNLKFDYTWQHDSFRKLGFIKSISPKHVIFKKSCKLHHIAYVTTTNYLWLPLITLVRCNPIIWKPHQCAHDMLNNFLCFYIWAIHIWITFPNDILVELSTKYFASQSSPHMRFASLPTKYASNLKVVVCCLTICKKNL
jgi:hypothetical protein